MSEQLRFGPKQMLMDERLKTDLSRAVSRYDAILAYLRYDHGHMGTEQSCFTCKRRAKALDAILTVWEVDHGE